MRSRIVERWVSAGLIDAGQASAIIAFENAQKKPWGKWAAFGLGSLAIGIGLVAVVASNWSEIPAAAKLSALFLLLVLSGVVVWRSHRADNVLMTELATFIYAVLALAGLGLIGQIFQLTSPLWRPLGFWLLITTPLIAGYGQGRLTAFMWSIVSAVFVASITDEFRNWMDAHPWSFGLMLAVPIAFLLPQAWRPATQRAAFWNGLRDFGVGSLVVGASLLTLSFYDYSAAELKLQGKYWSAALVLAIFSGAALYAGHLLRPMQMIVAAGTVVAIAALFIFASGTAGAILSTLLFCGFWATVAWAALIASHLILFRLAVGVIALRLIIVYFEVFGSLIQTGMGLIISGIVIIGITMIVLKLFQQRIST
jgi:uncharacterized membrane protein